MAGDLATTALALVAVCALAAAALRLLGRRSRRRAGALQVVAQLGVDGRRSVVVIEAAGRCFLVGMGEGPMSLLAELDPKEVAAAQARAETAAPKSVRGEALKRVLLGTRSAP